MTCSKKTKVIFACLFLLLFSGVIYASANTCPAETPACKKLIDLPASWKKELTIGAIIGGAIIDAINPCEIAILIFLMGTLLLNSERKKAFYTGLSFSLAIFLSYFLMGIGFLKIIQSVHFSSIIIKIIGTLTIILGILHLKDYISYNIGGFVMEVPKSWRPKMKNLIKIATGPIAAFFIGIIISLFLLPCTSGPYMVILALMAKNNLTQFSAVPYLLLYNLIFILPMLIITLSMYLGLGAIEAEELRKQRIKSLHLIAGLLLIILGIAILLRWI